MTLMHIGSGLTPLVTGDTVRELQENDRSQTNVSSNKEEFLSSLVEGLGYACKGAENLILIGCFACIGNNGAGPVSNMMGRVVEDLSAVQNTLDFVEFAGELNSSEPSEDENLKSMETAESVLVGTAFVLEPVFYLENLGLYTLGAASALMGTAQSGLLLGGDVVGMSAASYELSSAINDEKRLQERLQELQIACEANPEARLELLQSSGKLIEIQELIKTKILTLVRKVLDVIASIFGIVCIFAVPVIFLPLIAVLNAISASIGLYTLWHR